MRDAPRIPPKGTYARAWAEFEVAKRRAGRVIMADLRRDHGWLWLFVGMWLGFLILGIASLLGTGR